jgi:hypothetical protein
MKNGRIINILSHVSDEAMKNGRIIHILSHDSDEAMKNGRIIPSGSTSRGINTMIVIKT